MWWLFEYATSTSNAESTNRNFCIAYILLKASLPYPKIHRIKSVYVF